MTKTLKDGKRAARRPAKKARALAQLRMTNRYLSSLTQMYRRQTKQYGV